jgi:transcription antitermination protein NusB
MTRTPADSAHRMPARTKARKRALDILFEAELRGRSVLDTLSDRMAAGDPPVPEYTVDLVQGTVARIDEIDGVLAGYAEGWALDRMPAIDRNLLRLAAYELLCVDDVPSAVAISEAVRLASDLSTESSAHFVNGVLSSVDRDRPAVVQP